MLEFHADPAREMRIAKRIAYAIVLVFIVTVLPLYVLVLRLSPLELSVALGPALLTFIAVEMASRWEYRMRRRHAYPHLLGYRLPASRQVGRACAEGATLWSQLLRPEAVVIAWLKEDGQELEPVAAHGMPPDWLASARSITLAARSMKDAVDHGRVLIKPTTAGDPWFSAACPRARLVYVSLLSQERPPGLLA